MRTALAKLIHTAPGWWKACGADAIRRRQQLRDRRKGRSLCCVEFDLAWREVPVSSATSSSQGSDMASIGQAALRREAVIEGMEPLRVARRNVSAVEDQATLQRVTPIL